MLFCMDDMNKYVLTCVSGYWKVHNKYATTYDTWFKNTLAIQCPYVFFTDKETMECIKPFRQGLPTVYIEYPLEKFVTYKYKNKMVVDPLHCPSAELNLIWNEKIFLMKHAYVLNPFTSDYFC